MLGALTQKPGMRPPGGMPPVNMVRTFFMTSCLRLQMKQVVGTKRQHRNMPKPSEPASNPLPACEGFARPKKPLSRLQERQVPLFSFEPKSS